MKHGMNEQCDVIASNAERNNQQNSKARPQTSRPYCYDLRAGLQCRGLMSNDSSFLRIKTPCSSPAAPLPPPLTRGWRGQMRVDARAVALGVMLLIVAVSRVHDRAAVSMLPSNAGIRGSAPGKGLCG
eukprot:7390542-Prymnesium_polylepis.1